LQWKPKKILTKREYQKLSAKLKHYVSSYKKGQYILQGIPERYVNHCCESNTRVRGQSDIAIKSIKKGEEITSDYSKDATVLNFKCLCKSKNCKKYIRKQ